MNPFRNVKVKRLDQGTNNNGQKCLIKKGFLTKSHEMVFLCTLYDHNFPIVFSFFQYVALSKKHHPIAINIKAEEVIACRLY